MHTSAIIPALLMLSFAATSSPGDIVDPIYGLPCSKDCCPYDFQQVVGSWVITPLSETIGYAATEVAGGCNNTCRPCSKSYRIQSVDPECQPACVDWGGGLNCSSPGQNLDTVIRLWDDCSLSGGPVNSTGTAVLADSCGNGGVIDLWCACDYPLCY